MTQMDLPNDKQEQCVHSENNANCKIVIAYRKVDLWKKNNENCKIVIAYRKVDLWNQIEHTKGNTCMGTPPLQKVKQDLTCK